MELFRSRAYLAPACKALLHQGPLAVEVANRWMLACGTKRALLAVAVLGTTEAAVAKYGIDESIREGGAPMSSGAMWFLLCAALAVGIVAVHRIASHRIRQLERHCATASAQRAHAESALKAAAADHTECQARDAALRSLVLDFLDGVTSTEDFFEAADRQLHPKFVFDPDAAHAYLQATRGGTFGAYESQELLPWSPPGMDPALAAVMVPRGELTEAQWWTALADRLTAMVLKEPDPEAAARWAARVLGVPSTERPQEIGQSVVQHNLELRTAMTLAVMAKADPFPSDVQRGDADAAEALQGTDLATWLDLAASMVAPSSFD